MVQEFGEFWGLPRGHIGTGETPVQAAVRELKEETGIEKDLELREIGNYTRYTFDKVGLENGIEHKHITIFSALALEEYRTAPEDSDISASEWVDAHKVASLLVNDKDRSFFTHCLGVVLDI